MHYTNVDKDVTYVFRMLQIQKVSVKSGFPLGGGQPACRKFTVSVFPRYHSLTVTLLQRGAQPNILLRATKTGQPDRTSFRPRVFDRGPSPTNTQNRDNTKSGSQICSQFWPTIGVARQEKCRKLRRSLRGTYVRMSVALTYIGFCRGVAGARGRQSTLRSTAEASRASCGRPSITLAPYPPNKSTRTW